MKMIASLIPAALAATAVACGGSSSSPDASKSADAPASSVKVVSCPGTPDATVTAPSLAYTITYKTGSSIPVGGIVHFTMPAIHDAQSGAGGTPDTKFHVMFGQDQCLQFTQAGTFPFYCTVHLFTGSIVAQ